MDVDKIPLAVGAQSRHIQTRSPTEAGAEITLRADRTRTVLGGQSMMLIPYRNSKYTPANGVTRRPVPGPMAPERCITQNDSVSPDHVVLIGRDMAGIVRVKLELHRDDVSAWWLKVLRHWLAWCYGASEIKIVS